MRRSEPSPESAESAEVEVNPAGAKGRATPKRRDTTPRKQPMAAPRTNKEANQWRKQQRAQGSSKGDGATAKLSQREYRQALKKGDPKVLGRRDRGPTRALARDWVDSHRMLSNYLLVLFPLLLLSSAVPFLSIVTLAAFVLFLVEWYFTGRRIKALAETRFDEVRENPMTLGFYAGTRAYMPRKWRVPQARYRIGDEI